MYGLITFGAVGLALYNEHRKNNPAPVYYSNLLGVYNGITIPPFGILMSEKQRGNEDLLEHERIHWRQYQQKGLFGFYGDYISDLKRYGYDLHPMEIEARANESDFVKKNYTAAVRNGIAKTAYNPDFRKNTFSNCIDEIQNDLACFS